MEACPEQLRRHYGPGHLVVSVAGSVDPVGVLEVVEQSVGRPGEGVVEGPIPADESGGGVLRFVNKRTEQANVILGGYACSYPISSPVRRRSAECGAGGGDVQPAVPGAARGAGPGL